MKLSVSPPPYEGAPVVVFISGLGGSGSYWLPQLAALEPEYQVVCYDQLGTGNNPATLPEDYSLAQMADELARALADAGIVRYSVVGHALGALVGLQLALDGPDALTALVCVNGWLTLNAPAAAFRSASGCCITAAPRRGSRRSRCFSIRRTGWPPAPPVLRPKKRWRWPISRAKLTCCTGLAP